MSTSTHLANDNGDQQSTLAAPKVAPATRRPFNPKYVMMLVDGGVVALAVFLTYLIEQAAIVHLDLSGGANRFLELAMATVPLWWFAFSNQKLYNTRFLGRRIDEVRRIINACALGVLLTAVTGTVLGFLMPRAALLVLFFVSVALVTIEREVARRVFARLRTRGRLVRRVVIAGANPEGRDLAAMLQAEPWLGYKVLGFVDDTCTDPQPVAGVPLLGTIEQAAELVRRQDAAGVIVAASAIESETTNRLARDLLDCGIHVELSSTLRDIASQRLTVRPLGRFPVVYVEPVQRGGWRAAAKRAFDVAGAGVGLLLASPVLLAAAAAIKVSDRGPVLFSQVRVGRDSRPFRVLKLRTMVVDAEEQLADLLDRNEADGPLFKMRDDPRITRVGRFLRTTSIDEIPQLWNVLRGDMSLVGPRPALPHETEMWDPLLTQRLRVKPGITGMWQVNGRSESSFEDYTRLDLYYVDNWSLPTDLAILCKTVPVVLLRRGAA